MNIDKAIWLKRITDERARHATLPGSEWDQRNTPNDWIAKVCKYMARDVGNGPAKIKREDFVDDLTKAAAVILAALECVDLMERNGDFAHAPDGDAP